MHIKIVPNHQCSGITLWDYIHFKVRQILTLIVTVVTLMIQDAQHAANTSETQLKFVDIFFSLINQNTKILILIALKHKN